MARPGRREPDGPGGLLPRILGDGWGAAAHEPQMTAEGSRTIFVESGTKRWRLACRLWRAILGASPRGLYPKYAVEV